MDYSLHLGDCLEFMRGLEDGSVPHQLHICSDSHCACHSAARYEHAVSREN